MPGSLVIADANRYRLGQLFDLRDLGPQPLAGFTAQQRPWRVLGESGAVSRFEALRSVATRSSAATRSWTFCAAAGNRPDDWKLMKDAITEMSKVAGVACCS